MTAKCIDCKAEKELVPVRDVFICTTCLGERVADTGEAETFVRSDEK